jgi:hypothetical protein
MPAMRMMKVPFDQVVHMISMWHGFVAASRPMHMALIVCATAVPGGASVGVGGRHLNSMFIDMVTVHMVQVPVMQIINMASMPDSRVTTIGSVDMRMVRMLRIGAGRHVAPPGRCSIREGSRFARD